MEHRAVINPASRLKAEKLREQLEKLWSLPPDELLRRGMSEVAIQEILALKKRRPPRQRARPIP
jgi:hypothetical protein